MRRDRKVVLGGGGSARFFCLLLRSGVAPSPDAGSFRFLGAISGRLQKPLAATHRLPAASAGPVSLNRLQKREKQ